MKEHTRFTCVCVWGGGVLLLETLLFSDHKCSGCECEYSFVLKATDRIEFQRVLIVRTVTPHGLVGVCGRCFQALANFRQDIRCRISDHIVIVIAVRTLNIILFYFDLYRPVFNGTDSSV
jgi:hypothetical protein